MYSIFLVFSLSLILRGSYSCIPTQNVDPFPCKTCSKVYDSSCQGGGTYGGCETADVVGVSYTLGPVAGVDGTDADTCWTSLSCPSDTLRTYALSSGGYSGGNGYGGETISYCRESGFAAGVWAIWQSDTRVDISSMSCQYS
ncbi:hypothetical protein CRE_11737 [Caenorhabditis remanei]|uniref:Uncharacterized protein n=1 Tax=Caenorhabditis remanei TaxID=31234 RepID=E3M4E3_CAERE|nr:hypothetical protein CRE_11737 [Caenorhabditis remanei]